jgi:uncharacterized membrane protein
MLIHFPSALYPFSFVMDGLGFLLNNNSFNSAGLYSLIGAIGASILAIVYGTIDFLSIESGTNIWRKAGIHALLNSTWFIVFSILLLYRMKNPEEPIGWIYLTIMGSALIGLFYSNYLGADLIVKHRIGIE